MPRYAVNNPFGASPDNPNAAPISAGINNIATAFFGDPKDDPTLDAKNEAVTQKTNLESSALKLKQGAYGSVNDAFIPDPKTQQVDTGKIAAAYSSLADLVGPEDAAKYMQAKIALSPHTTDDQRALAQVGAGKTLSPDASLSLPGQAAMRSNIVQDKVAEVAGTEQAKVMADKPKAIAAVQTTSSDLDRLAASAAELMNHKGLPRITGVMGTLSNIPGGAAADAQAKLDTLKSQVSLDVLQNMRNNSKTGGALGNVSDAEGVRLENNLAALDKAQSYGEFKNQLQKIIDYSQSAKVRLNDAFLTTYGADQAGQPGLSTAAPAAAPAAAFNAPLAPPMPGSAQATQPPTAAAAAPPAAPKQVNWLIKNGKLVPQ